MRRWLWILVLGTLAACSTGGGNGGTAGCPRQENGQTMDTPCPVGSVCEEYRTGLVCARQCQSDRDCPASECCQPLFDSAGPRSYGGCFVPDATRSLCTGPASPGSMLAGAYVGMYTATQTSDRMSVAPLTTRESAYGIRVAQGSGTFTFTVDPGCTLAATGLTSTSVSFTAGSRCTPQQLTRNAELILASGSASLVGTALTVNLRFRYSRTDTEDSGIFEWSYTGTRR